MEFSSQEYWGGLPNPPPRDLPNPGIKPTISEAPALLADSLPLSHHFYTIRHIQTFKSKVLNSWKIQRSRKGWDYFRMSKSFKFTFKFSEEYNVTIRVPKKWQPTPVLLPREFHAVHGVAQSWTQLKQHSMHWRRKWQPTPVFLPGESQGQGSLVGCHLWGRTESDTTEAT